MWTRIKTVPQRIRNLMAIGQWLQLPGINYCRLRCFTLLCFAGRKCSRPAFWPEECPLLWSNLQNRSFNEYYNKNCWLPSEYSLSFCFMINTYALFNPFLGIKMTAEFISVSYSIIDFILISVEECRSPSPTGSQSATLPQTVPPLKWPFPSPDPPASTLKNKTSTSALTQIHHLLQHQRQK